MKPELLTCIGLKRKECVSMYAVRSGLHAMRLFRGRSFLLRFEMRCIRLSLEVNHDGECVLYVLYQLAWG